MTAAIEVADLTVSYGDVLALDGASLSVAAGRVTGLIGMNGSGKSTLFSALMGAVRPDHGTVRIGGLPSSAARRGGLVGYVPQAEAVDWAFPVSVRDVVMMGRYGRLGTTRRAGRADHAAVDEALARVELTELAGRQIGRLSGGQKKRAFVARGIAQGAEVLLLDEPFAGVDKRSEATIVRLLRELASAGRTVLVSTHDLHALPALADEAALLQRRVLFHGPVGEALAPERLALAFGVTPVHSATPSVTPVHSATPSVTPAHQATPSVAPAHRATPLATGEHA
ncbi:metal ABC transporter ATP-binding protein [Leucobacter luti]|uniref:Manganese transport system ATP-binding protein n=1 Tax=Leucobacter luti TaxID=340320 RepID=A0A4Q7TP33_9MICO|nr:metal ABC transporter ATP-binding protein [Leucobacter luti]MBL3700215.1 metal ABC transporter ATP-binding protein [Leucobacter luti]RZT61062.1 manganese transport system ATP-binding protein [Leucobacter luti]